MKYFSYANWWSVNGSEEYPRVFKIIIHIIIWIFAIVTIIMQFPFGTVGAGERGIKLRFNAPTGDVLNQGLYFRVPFVERVVTVDVQTQKVESHALAYSKDLQTVDSAIALNYHLNPESVEKLYTEIGVDYRDRIISPAIQEAVKAATAQFTAQELIEKRPVVKDEIKSQLVERLQGKYMTVDEFSIINFDFSDAFESAIEAKQVAQQTAFTEKNKLESVKFQAEQRIAQSKAEAEAIRIQAEAITSQGGKEYVELKRIEKWDGRYPSTMLDNATPLLNVQ